MPISPVRAGIGGDGNEKWCCLIPSYSSLLSNFKVQGSGFRVVVAASPQVYMGRCPKVAFKLQVTSH